MIVRKRSACSSQAFIPFIPTCNKAAALLAAQEGQVCSEAGGKNVFREIREFAPAFFSHKKDISHGVLHRQHFGRRRAFPMGGQVKTDDPVSFRHNLLCKDMQSGAFFTAGKTVYTQNYPFQRFVPQDRHTVFAGDRIVVRFSPAARNRCWCRAG